MMKYEVIDNFLDKEYFDDLVVLFVEKEIGEGNFTMSWYYNSSVSHVKEHKKWVKEDNIFYMTHLLYSRNIPTSANYDHLIPLLEKLKVNCLLRVKANLFPNTHKLHEHPMHIDYKFSHSGAILSLNTCDGYTKLKDGTKIDSIANRILLFDPSEEHCSTTTTNVSARFNININYIQEQL